MRFLATALTLLTFASLPASAHVSVDHGFSFAAGLQHPVTGLDHLTAMVAVGLWAALAGGRRLWIWPLAFVASMLGGGALAHSEITIPYTEPALAASVFLFGLAIALLAKLPASIGAALIAMFGLAHGYAHGLEAPSTGWAGYAAGFALTTVALHCAGIGFGLAIPRLGGARLARLAGLVAMVIGIAVFAQQ